MQETRETLKVEDLTIDLTRRCVYRGRERLPLTPKPLEVLKYLIQNSGRVISKEELLASVWRGHHEGNTVEVAIRQIRRVLGESKDNPRYIRTIPGEGYCFIGVVEAGGGEEKGEKGERERRGTWAEYFKGWRVRVGAAGLALAIGVSVLGRGVAVPRAVNPVRVTHSQRRVLSPLLAGRDGVYYQGFVNGKYEVSEVGWDGRERVVETEGVGNPELCDIDGTGEWLLLRSLKGSRDDNGYVYVQAVGGGKGRRVGTVQAYDAAWYPDGKRILYSAGGEVYATDVQGKEQRRLWAVPGNAYWFRWSPDGRRVRFTVIDRKTEATSIWEGAEGRGMAWPVFPEFGYPQCCGSWMADGGYFVFQVRVGSGFQIWGRTERGSVFLGDNGRPKALIAGAWSYRGPAPSRDGRKVFVRAEAAKGQFVRWDGRSGQFETVLAPVSGRTLSYSRDGEWVAYSSLADNNLWRCRADGAECIPLTKGMQQTVLPRWSPDGRRIAFMGRREVGNWGIYTVGANGEELQSLSQGNRSEGDPDWSADGERLVFGNVLEPLESRALYLLNVRTREASMLAGSRGYHWPRWSPSGRNIVAVESGSEELAVVDWETGRWERLRGVTGAYPTWSGDGRYVYFLGLRNGRRVVLRMEMEGRRVEEVVAMETVERAPFMMGDWIGLMPDDSVVAVRNVSSDEIYSWDLETK